MTDLNPELIAKAADVIDIRRHEYRVNTVTWKPYCICGWSAEEPDVTTFDHHLAELAIEAVADDLRAEGAARARKESTMTDKPTREARYVRAEETTTCPRCDAQPGDQCRTAPRGRWRRNPHVVRIKAMERNDELTFSVPEEER